MAEEVRVWDPLVRLGHWALVATVAGAWFTQTGGGKVHEWLGYASLAIVTVRVVWGFAGPRRARFADFVRAMPSTLDYTWQVLQHRDPRYVGHNPLGGWMIVTLIAGVVAVDLSGWLYTTDRYWGVEWVEDLHGALSNLLVTLVVVHVAGAIFASRRHGENLVAAMVHGRKRRARPGDVD